MTARWTTPPSKAVLSALKARLSAQRGAHAEARAEAHLKQQGLRPIARNWRCARGELDLVMADGETLVIVEVRARSSASHGSAMESISAKKRASLLRATLAFVQAHPRWQDAPIRFDVIGFEAELGRWLPNAFDADDIAA